MLIFQNSQSVRLHKIFQFIDGFKAEYNLRGFLHVGFDYAVFIRTPKPHDKYIVYELYEARNVPDSNVYKPQMLAIAQVPIDYLKEQLVIFRNELYKAKYVDDNVIPGTQVKTLREWQLDRALASHDGLKPLYNRVPMLRSVL